MKAVPPVSIQPHTTDRYGRTAQASGHQPSTVTVTPKLRLQVP
jgi:hypothetical protein